SVTSVTRTETLPSSMSSTSPGRQSPGRPLKEVETRSRVPSMSSVEMVRVSPTSSSCGPSADLPRRIFGPWRSTSTATFFPAPAAALGVLGCAGEGLAGRELGRTVGEPAQADLRAREVEQDGDVLPEVLGGPADVRVHLRVIVVRAVAEIHPGDVHPGFDQSA